MKSNSIRCSALSLVLLPLIGGFLSESSNAAALINFDNVALTVDANHVRSNFTGTIGSLFQVGSNQIQITALGIQDVDSTTGNAGSNGFFASPLSVGLWTSTGTLIASTTVSNGTSTADSDGYRYASITPVTLQANTQYLIGALVGGGLEWFLDDNAAGQTHFSAGTGDISLIDARLNNNSSTLAAPLSSGGAPAGRWGAASAQFTVVPEPSTALLGGMGVLLAMRRRRSAM